VQNFILLQQAMWRRYKARCLRLYMLEQQASDWEQLWSRDERCFYYYNKRTGESRWEEPEGPYRPIVRDSYTGKLVQAWPQLDLPPVVEKKAGRGMCMKCFTREANRRCTTCFKESTKADWNKGYAYYCFGCFADIHKDDPALREHGFTVVKSAAAPKLKCSVCRELATRVCHGILLTERHRERLANITARARVSPAGRLKLEEFTAAFVEQLGLEYSRKKIEVIYRECQGGSLPAHELWTRVAHVLEDYQEACGDNYCAACWQDSHKKGQRAKHVWSGFAAGWNACVSCEREPAQLLCEGCDDELCQTCFKAAHVKGRKRMHKTRELKEQVSEEEFYCAACSRRAGALECQDCRAPLCDSCLAFVHAPKCEGKLRPPEEEEEEEEEVGDDDAAARALKPLYATACSVCGKVPDTMCMECGDVYCSEQWHGNPGCFARMHRRGNRKRHTQRPYTYCQELSEMRIRQRLEEDRRRREEEAEEASRLAAQEALSRRVQDVMAKKQELRQRRLVEEAQAEVSRRLTHRGAE
jgi:hypothetical protein